MDGITSSVIKRAWKAIPLYIKSMYDECLRSGYYPSEWKEARVVALLKGDDKDKKEPGSYRPISLLSGLGKVMERMMVERLMSDMGDKWSECQYGFVQGKSTMDAWLKLKECVSEAGGRYAAGVFVDFRGAFDNLRWSAILKRLRMAGCRGNDWNVWKSYFKERSAWMKAMSESVRINVERGCPQGSISGPTLWNLCMNELLIQLHERFQSVIAYADDLVIVVAGNSRAELERLIAECLRIVCAWGKRVGVGLSTEKTVCLLLKGKCDLYGRSVKVCLSESESIRVRYAKSVRYLGVMVSERMNFREHVWGMRKRVVNKVGCLKRVLRKDWGMNVKVATVWANCVIAAAVMYGCGVWYEVLETMAAREEMNRCMRVVMYACVRVCRTVSTEAMQVLLGWLPWDLECKMRATVFKIKRGLRMGRMDAIDGGEVERLGVDEACRVVERRVYEAWQRRWDGCTKGRVTYEFIKNVRFAERTRAFEPSLRVCYILTGHGTLNAWLYERRLADSPLCVCGKAPETWAHFLCECEMYECFRDLEGMGVRVGVNEREGIRVGNLFMNVSRVLSARETYECMCTFVERAYKMRESVTRRLNEE